MGKKYVSKKEKDGKAELKLLLSLARGKKTLQQVVDDASDFSFAGDRLKRLVTSNPARGVTATIAGSHWI